MTHIITCTVAELTVASNQECAKFDASAVESALAQIPNDLTFTLRVDIDSMLADADQIAILWCVDDVLEMRPDLNREKAFEVLENAKQYHDACEGMSWSTLADSAEALFGDAPEHAIEKDE